MRKAITMTMCLFAALAQAQTIERSVVASGGGSANTLDWTIGEVVISAATTSDYALTQGFQQPGVSISSVSEPLTAEFDVRVFPNPFMQGITIQSATHASGPLQLVLTDVSGKVIVQDTLYGGKGEYDLAELASGVYVLRLQQNEGEWRTFRLIKQN